jgi:hypothetical protein
MADNIDEPPNENGKWDNIPDLRFPGKFTEPRTIYAVSLIQEWGPNPHRYTAGYILSIGDVT